MSNGTRVRVGGGGQVSRVGTIRPIGTYAGTFNPSLGLPTTGTGVNGSIIKGDYWNASASGAISGLTPFEDFVLGDLIYAITNNADTVDEFLGNKGSGGSGDITDILPVITSGGTVTLDFASKVKRIFVGSASFSTPKSVVLSNNTEANEYFLFLNITNVAAVITFESDYLSNIPGWDSGSKTWTPFNIGKFKFTGVYDGTDWWLSMETEPYI